MSKKHLATTARRVLVPALIMLLAFPQVVSAMTSDELLQLSESKTVVSVAASTGATTSQSASTYKQTYQLTTFPKLRVALEQIFPTQTKPDGKKEGELYLIATPLRATKTAHKDSPSYIGVVMNQEFQNKLQDKQMKDALSKAAENTFSDVKSTDWFAQFIPLAVYYGVISGDSGEGGTFRPNAPVSRAEFASMLATAVYGRYDVSEQQERTDSIIGRIKSIDKNAWYAGAWNLVSGGMISVKKSTTKAELTAPMTRMEVALAISENSQIGVKADDFYMSVNTSNKFPDLKVRDFGNTEEMSTLDLINISKSEPSKGIYKAYYNALLALSEKGIMTGMPDGTMQPLRPVTRAEVLVMLQKVAKVTGDEYAK